MIKSHWFQPTFVPRWIHLMIMVWIKSMTTKKLLFLMDAARAMTVVTWILVLGFGWLESGRYLKAVDVLAQNSNSGSGMWPDQRLGFLDQQIKALNDKQTGMVEILNAIDKKVTLMDIQIQADSKRLDKSEQFWASLQDKFLFAVIGQLGILFIWFLLGKDLKRRISKEHDDFMTTRKVLFRKETEEEE